MKKIEDYILHKLMCEDYHKKGIAFELINIQYKAHRCFQKRFSYAQDVM